jgi:hypothetical protein
VRSPRGFPEAKEQAENAKANVTAKVAELQQQMAAANELQPKLDAPRKNAKPPSKQKRCKALRPRRRVRRRSPCAYTGVD